MGPLYTLVLLGAPGSGLQEGFAFFAVGINIHLPSPGSEGLSKGAGLYRCGCTPSFLGLPLMNTLGIIGLYSV